MISYIPGGTQYESTQVNDVIELGQANRGIVEFDYDNPGRYMFHASCTGVYRFRMDGII